MAHPMPGLVQNWSYTWVSTGLELYGIKKVKNDVYAVSPAIRNSSSNPSQREMLFCEC